MCLALVSDLCSELADLDIAHHVDSIPVLIGGESRPGHMHVEWQRFQHFITFQSTNCSPDMTLLLLQSGIVGYQEQLSSALGYLLRLV